MVARNENMTSQSRETLLRELFRSLDRRLRPEDVADLVLRVLGDGADKATRGVVNRAARQAHGRLGWGYSSMSADFARPADFNRQLATAAALFPRVEGAACAGGGDDVGRVRAYAGRAGATIGKEVGRNDFLRHRLCADARKLAGVDLSRRQYNKRFRLLARIERKCARVEREWTKRGFTLVGKSRLASQLTWEEFSADVPSACFVAYFASRCGLRSEFTNGPQERPYDEVAHALFCHATAGPAPNWWAIAHVFPERQVLVHLSDEQKGRLLGEWFRLLEQVAEFLRQTWEANRFDRKSMVVRRGNDSSTWNVTAGAWNKARDAWVNLLYALEFDGVLEAMCPGKVLRLMAADVAWWHRAGGGGLAPDTAVWAALPLPWDVLSGRAECRLGFVEEVCRAHGVDPVKSGWVAPKPQAVARPFRPTPELVHGVTVCHPGLAAQLRKLGVFSGKALKMSAS
jgi:hypothetical protein